MAGFRSGKYVGIAARVLRFPFYYRSDKLPVHKVDFPAMNIDREPLNFLMSFGVYFLK